MQQEAIEVGTLALTSTPPRLLAALTYFTAQQAMDQFSIEKVSDYSS